MSDNRTPKFRGGVIAHWLNRLVRRFGFILLPISEIERMEQDAEDWYPLVRREKTGSYFNGLADYASKKALLLRERYLPNDPRDLRNSQPHARYGLTESK